MGVKLRGALNQLARKSRALGVSGMRLTIALVGCTALAHAFWACAVETPANTVRSESTPNIRVLAGEGETKGAKELFTELRFVPAATALVIVDVYDYASPKCASHFQKWYESYVKRVVQLIKL